MTVITAYILANSEVSLVISMWEGRKCKQAYLGYKEEQKEKGPRMEGRIMWEGGGGREKEKKRVDAHPFIHSPLAF
jgi:hypothetical protein